MFLLYNNVILSAFQSMKSTSHLYALILAFFVLVALPAKGQTEIHGVVRDEQSNSPLPYCNIIIQGTSNGTITNGDGVFTISADTSKDVLLFAYLGYQRKALRASVLLNNNNVFLKSLNVSLNEVTVHPGNDFLYDLVYDCRKNLPTYKPQNVARVYLGLETSADSHPVELLECYYNGYLNGINLEKLLIKNGRVAWDTVGNRYFMSLGTSKAISELNLTKRNDHFPGLPLQFNKGRMKKKFHLRMLASNDQYYEIEYSPIRDSSEYFSGKIWIDNHKNLLKLEMSGKELARYPFSPLFPMDSLSHVDLSISQTFKEIDGMLLPDHINFQYQFTYKSVRDSNLVMFPSIVTNTFTSRGILYFYDYNKPFILPHYDYDAGFNDYRKMSFIPYNELFWNNNNKLQLTSQQKEDLGFFARKGNSMNFNAVHDLGNSYLHHVVMPRNIEGNWHKKNIIWSADHRLSVGNNIVDNTEIAKEKINQSIPLNLINLKVQILLDITQIGDSLYHSSYTIFDNYKSFYHLPRYPYTNCFLNIYFDLCEIEREKMEKQLPQIGYDLDSINAVYNQSVVEMHSLTQRYIRETHLGADKKAMHKWSDYVKDKLNIDNMKMYSDEMDGETGN